MVSFADPIEAGNPAELPERDYTADPHAGRFAH
jgi:hypothetical protein